MKEAIIKAQIEALSFEDRELLSIKLQELVKRDSKTRSESPKKLVAYIQSNSELATKEIFAFMKSSVPDYMIPASIHKIKEIPLLPNGKIDKKALPNKIDRSAEAALKIALKPSDKVDLTGVEQVLLKIWEEVLNVEPIYGDDNFFELGGDSILSIQIIAKARKQGLLIAPNDLFEHQTVSELAMFATFEKEEASNSEIYVGEIPLTPIQHWFFETHKSAPHFWNQAISLPNTNGVAIDKIKAIVQSIVTQHDALRSLFYKSDVQWRAKIIHPDQVISFYEFYIEGSKDDFISLKLQDIQQRVDLTKGPLFRCLYFKSENPSEDTIVLLAHHLVIDTISWQIVSEHFVSMLSADTIEQDGFKTTSVKKWGDHLKEKANSNALLREIPFWKTQTSHQVTLPTDFEMTHPIIEKEVRTLEDSLDADQTSLLVGKANDAYNTKTEELLLTAFVETISNWSEQEEVFIGMERHGRETGGTTIDLTNTVGWLTAYYPLLFTFKKQYTLEEKLISVKEHFRSIPNGGVGYGMLRYLTSALEAVDYPQIVFNFLGKQSKGSSDIKIIKTALRDSNSERNYRIEINAVIADGELVIKWSYAEKAFMEETITRLLSNFISNLNTIIATCSNTEIGKYTPSDFPEVDLNQDDLNSLLNNLE